MSPAGREDATPRSRPPSPPAGGGSSEGGDGSCYRDIAHPVPIALNLATVLKLVVPIVGAIITGASFAAYFYYKTNAHLTDQQAHLAKGERHQLETKKQARKARVRMLKAVKRDNALRAREIRVEQRELIGKMGIKLETKQQERHTKILREVQRTRRAVE